MNVYAAIALQVAAALVVTWLVYLMATKLVLEQDIAQQEKTLATGVVTTKVIDGTATNQVLTSVRFDTVNPTAPNFVRMPRCTTNCDGNSFTMSLWMRMHSVPPTDTIVFVKGDPTHYPTPHNNAVLIKCPLFKITSHQDPKDPTSPKFGLSLQFNTLANQHNEISIAPDAVIAGSLDISSILNNWVLISIVFLDSSRADGAPIGFTARIYLNNVLLIQRTFDRDAIRWNNGDLVFFPPPSSTTVASQPAANHVTIADFTYTNKSLSHGEVQGVFKRKFNARPARIPHINLGIRTSEDILDITQFNIAKMP